MFRRPVRPGSSYSAPRHHPDKLDPVAMLQPASRPLLPQQNLAIEFDQQAARIKAAVRREFTQGHRGVHLAGATVDENAQPSVDSSHDGSAGPAFLRVGQIKIKDHSFLGGVAPQD